MYRTQLDAAILQAAEDYYATYDYCEFVNNRKKEAKTICLYGTGNFFENYVQHMEKYDYVCDGNGERGMEGGSASLRNNCQNWSQLLYSSCWETTKM